MRKAPIVRGFDRVRALRSKVYGAAFFSRGLGTAAIFLMVSGVGAPAINHNLNRHADLLCVSPALSPRTGSDEFGLSLGRRAPSFVLKDQNERDISLASLVEKGTAVLVFYRSADWCPFCKQQLVDLQRNLKEIEASGGQLVGISYDSVAILKRFASRRIGFPLLSDSGSRTIDAYNIRDQSTRDGVSRHATFVIDRKGIVRAKLFQVSYAERPAVDDLIKAIKEAQ